MQPDPCTLTITLLDNHADRLDAVSGQSHALEIPGTIAAAILEARLVGQHIER